MRKDFLTLFDITPGDLEGLFVLADELRSAPSLPLRGKSVAMIFQKPSLRTRVSFEVGIAQLGGHPVVLSQEGIGIGSRESAQDIARFLSRLCHAVVARLFDHSVLEDLASFASIPVINALTDLSHPCQVLADLYTMRQHNRLKPGVKVAFVGDGNNVVHSWLEAAPLYPFDFVLAAPDKYHPDPTVLQRAQQAAQGTISVVHDPAEAVHNADVLYTDVWVSMGQESESEKRRKDFAGYQINGPLLAQAKKDCIVMHCLPAHRGEEITAEVIDGPHSVVFDEAENRLHVQKAILATLVS